MTEEEKAEEYAEKSLKGFREYIYLDQAETKIEDAYLAGFHEGQPKWHDLRKDPNDLPDTDRFVHVQTMSDTGKAYYDDGWYSGGINGIVIAWCEEPQFKG